MPIPDDYPFDLPFENGEGLDDAFRDIPKSPDLEDVDDEFKKMNCYKGNLSLKGNNVQVPMSPAHVEEFKKCRADIFYFLINYGRIISLDDGEINFSLYQYQKNMIHLINSHRFSIHLLPRQMGKCARKSTVVKIRNKHTGEIKEITMGEFHELSKNKGS